MAALDRLYIDPKYPGYTPVSFYTPEQFWPITGPTSQSFSQSIQQGALLLDNAITTLFRHSTQRAASRVSGQPCTTRGQCTISSSWSICAQ